MESLTHCYWTSGYPPAANSFLSPLSGGKLTQCLQRTEQLHERPWVNYSVRTSATALVYRVTNMRSNNTFDVRIQRAHQLSR